MYIHNCLSHLVLCWSYDELATSSCCTTSFKWDMHPLTHMHTIQTMTKLVQEASEGIVYSVSFGSQHGLFR